MRGISRLLSRPELQRRIIELEQRVDIQRDHNQRIAERLAQHKDIIDLLLDYLDLELYKTPAKEGLRKRSAEGGSDETTTPS